MKIGAILKAAVKVAKSNPALVIAAVGVIGPVVKAVKQEVRTARSDS